MDECSGNNHTGTELANDSHCNIVDCLERQLGKQDRQPDT